MLLVISSNF